MPIYHSMVHRHHCEHCNDVKIRCEMEIINKKTENGALKISLHTHCASQNLLFLRLDIRGLIEMHILVFATNLKMTTFHSTRTYV